MTFPSIELPSRPLTVVRLSDTMRGMERITTFRYHLWRFWHRFRPWALWDKLTTYTVPITIAYGDSANQRTYMQRKRWDKTQPDYRASVNVRCADADDWETVEGVVLYECDNRGRLVSIGVGFDLPCGDTTEGQPFYLDAWNVS